MRLYAESKIIQIPRIESERVSWVVMSKTDRPLMAIPIPVR